MPRGQTEQLIQFGQYDEETRHRMAVNGGKKSGEARREKKKLKDLLEIALSLTNSEGIDNYTTMTLALIQKAMDGDTKAYEVVRDTLGQKPKEEVELTTGNVIEINIGKPGESSEL